MSRADDDAAVAQLVELFAEVGEPRARRMFGGVGLHLDGVMVALVADGVAYLKVDAATRTAFVAAGSAPFTYQPAGRPKPTVMSYWRLPDGALDDQEEATRWASLARDAAERGRK
jgi:DNA transformation protein